MIRRFCVFVIAVITLAVLPGCNFSAESEARRGVLMPVIQADTPNIVEAAEDGVPYLTEDLRPNAQNKIDEFESLVESGDPMQIGLNVMALWPEIERLARLGYSRRAANGEIGPGVYDILVDRLDEYENSLRAAARGE